jgi:phage terminase Nu1 subunit (DNA packaging protein)
MAHKFFSTLKEMAKEFGVSVHTLQNWRADGAPKRTNKGWSFESWKKWIEKRDALQGYKRRERSTDNRNARDRKEIAEADIKELTVRKLRGELLSRESVVRCWSKYVTGARQILLTLPAAISLLVPDGELRNLIHKEVLRLVDDALRELEEAGKLDSEAKQIEGEAA